MFEQLSQLDTLTLNFDKDGMFILNIAIGFIMFGVALGIRLKNFKTVFLKPKTLIVGVLSQFVFLPAITFLLIVLCKDFITIGVGLGMILVAACPGGNISNFISSLAKGNVELSVSLTAFATLMAVILTPLNFAFWGKLYLGFMQNVAEGSELLRPLSIDAIEMFKTVFILLGIPLVIGMTFAWKLPKVTAKIQKPLQNLSIVLFLVIVVIAFKNNFDLFLKYIQYIIVIVLIHNAIAFTTGFSLASIFGIKRNSRRTITIETGIQNSGLALALLFNPKIFDPELPIGGLLFIAGWWGIWHIISGLTVASIWRKIPLKKF
jgi:BASS family bile acid:Na+ symporter